eukprot:COSAG02_NODE_1575_length_11877_cov_43.830871_4_plen_93_part_00
MNAVPVFCWIRNHFQLRKAGDDEYLVYETAWDLGWRDFAFTNQDYTIGVCGVAISEVYEISFQDKNAMLGGICMSRHKYLLRPRALLDNIGC